MFLIHISNVVKGADYLVVKVRGVSWFWYLRIFDSHETFIGSSLALNMSRKLLDPYLAIHGKIMAKNGHFFMEFRPIFHKLRSYVCSKRDVLGFCNQATHRRLDDEPIFYFGVHHGQSRVWRRYFEAKNQFLFEMVQKGPDRPKMVPTGRNGRNERAREGKREKSVTFVRKMI